MNTYIGKICPYCRRRFNGGEDVVFAVRVNCLIINPAGWIMEDAQATDVTEAV